MKAIRFASFMLVVLLVVAACQPAAAPTPAAKPTEAPKPTEAAASKPTEPAAAKPTVSSAAAAVPDLGGKDVTVAIENAYIPFNYIRLDNGKAEGWDYDALAEICKRLNCKPVFKEIGWDSMITAVSQGQFDVAADGITITDERAKVVDFSDGYMSVDQRVMVRQRCADHERRRIQDEREVEDRNAEGHDELRRSGEDGGREPRHGLRHVWRCGAGVDQQGCGRRGDRRHGRCRAMWA